MYAFFFWNSKEHCDRWVSVHRDRQVVKIAIAKRNGEGVHMYFSSEHFISQTSFRGNPSQITVGCVSVRNKSKSKSKKKTKNEKSMTKWSVRGERSHWNIMCCTVIQYSITVCMTSSYLPFAYRLIGYSIFERCERPIYRLFVSLYSAVGCCCCCWWPFIRSVGRWVPSSTSLIFDLSTIVRR